MVVSATRRWQRRDEPGLVCFGRALCRGKLVVCTVPNEARNDPSKEVSRDFGVAREREGEGLLLNGVVASAVL